MFLIRFAKLFLNDVIITCLKVITILLEFKLLVYIIHFGLIFQLHIYCEYYLNLFGYCNLYPVVQESNTLNSFSVLFIFVSQYLPLFHPCIAISVLYHTIYPPFIPEKLTHKSYYHSLKTAELTAPISLNLTLWPFFFILTNICVKILNSFHIFI